jgi:hypothetical protein
MINRLPFHLIVYQDHRRFFNYHTPAKLRTTLNKLENLWNWGERKDVVLVCVFTWIFSWLVGLMVFNATFNNIPVISLQSVLLVEETGVPGENHRPVATDRLYHIMLYSSPWSRFALTTSVVIGTDCIGSCRSNYHTITAATGWPIFRVPVIYLLVWELDLQRKKCNIIYYTIHHISLEEVNVANPYLQRNYYLKGH